MQITPADAPATSPETGLVRQILAQSPQMMLVKHQMKKGWIGKPHAHPPHQLVYVLSGAIAFTVDGNTQTVKAGESFIVDSNVTHQARALDDSEVLDVFSPIGADPKP